MPNFEVQRITGLPPNAVEPFYKLIVDGHCYFDDFCAQMTKAGNQKKALEKLQVIMIQLSKGIRVPTTWFQELKHRSADDPYPDFEIRVKQLRFYLFEEEASGKIIVLGELKDAKTQSKSIDKMRALKLAYFKSKAL